MCGEPIQKLQTEEERINNEKFQMNIRRNNRNVIIK